MLRWSGFVLAYSLLALLSFLSRDHWSFSTTVWLPAGLVFALLWYSPRREWPLWLATAGTLHILSGLWIGRPLLMASLFALFDLLLYPLCVLAMRAHLRHFFVRALRNPVAATLFQLTLLTVIVVSLSVLLTASLMLAHYPVAYYHFISWALAALTCILATWPFIQSASAGGQMRRQDYILMALNAALTGLLVTPLAKSFAPGLLLLWLQFAVLLLSSFALSARAMALLLLLQCGVIICGTLQQSGLFYSLASSPLIAIWQAEVYVLFSSTIVICVMQFMYYHQQHLSRLAGDQALMQTLTQAGSCLTFTVSMPDAELHWSGSPASFFPGGYLEMGSLTLLNAHCEPPFLSDFYRWYSHKNSQPFCRRLCLHQLDGHTIHCLLVIQPLPAQPIMTGGLARMP